MLKVSARQFAAALSELHQDVVRNLLASKIKYAMEKSENSVVAHIDSTFVTDKEGVVAVFQDVLKKGARIANGPKIFKGNWKVELVPGTMVKKYSTMKFAADPLPPPTHAAPGGDAGAPPAAPPAPDAGGPTIPPMGGGDAGAPPAPDAGAPDMGGAPAPDASAPPAGGDMAGSPEVDAAKFKIFIENAVKDAGYKLLTLTILRNNKAMSLAVDTENNLITQRDMIQLATKLAGNNQGWSLKDDALEKKSGSWVINFSKGA